MYLGITLCWAPLPELHRHVAIVKVVGLVTIEVFLKYFIRKYFGSFVLFLYAP